jgi:preprotein translocase subunit YajC
MNLHSVNVLLADATNAPGQPPMEASPQAKMIQTVSMLGIMVFLFYFLAIRPQSKKAKEQAAMLKTVKPGDKIITSSGIVGTVVAVKERTISLRSAETKLEVLKSAITDITKSDGEAEAS